MEIKNYIEIIIIIVLIIGTIPVIIFCFRLKNSDDVNYYELINNLNKQKEENLKELKIGVKKINDLEKKISYYKKELKHNNSSKYQ